MPSLFLDRTGLLKTLRSTILCAGVPLVSTALSLGTVSGFSAISPLLNAYSNFYQQDNAGYAYIVRSRPSESARGRQSCCGGD